MFLSGMHMITPGSGLGARGSRIFPRAPSLEPGADFVYDFRNINPHRAGTHAASAAGTEGLAELVVIILELVHDPVAVPLGLHIPGIVPRSVIGELAETAGVPVLAPCSFPLRPFVIDIEAVAGRADKGA